MRTKRILNYVTTGCIVVLVTACSLPSSLVEKNENKQTPTGYNNNPQDTVNTAKVNWKEYFTDPNLVGLIDTALHNNQEYNIMLQEINIARNEVRARKGEYLPFLSIGAGASIEKPGQYTTQGAVEENLNIREDQRFPEPLPNFMLGVNASWEVDIWKKLRNAKKAAMFRYLSTTEGRNFMVTNLIAEIANSYYELMALDNRLEILKRNISIQQNALEIVRMEKQAAKVTELAVRKFEAEVLKNQSGLYDIMQAITETENRINFLVGRFPQHISRNSQTFTDLPLDSIHAGIPSQLLQNRTDIRQAEFDLASAKINIKVAKANFYPSLHISAGVGYEAFNTKYLVTSPQSLLYTVAGDLMAPLINRNAIKAYYYTSTSKQIQAVYNYERTVLNAYVEVANQLSNIRNLSRSYDLKAKQVEALTQSIDISIRLFRSARADYMEVLLTQRDALESKFELIETKKQQLNARVNVYQALGGGWN